MFCKNDRSPPAKTKKLSCCDIKALVNSCAPDSPSLLCNVVKLLTISSLMSLFLHLNTQLPACTVHALKIRFTCMCHPIEWGKIRPRFTNSWKNQSCWGRHVSMFIGSNRIDQPGVFPSVFQDRKAINLKLYRKYYFRKLETPLEGSNTCRDKHPLFGLRPCSVVARVASQEGTQLQATQ